MSEERSPFPRAFVSYVREDWDTVKRLCDELKAGGIEVWLDKRTASGSLTPALAAGRDADSRKARGQALKPLVH